MSKTKLQKKVCHDSFHAFMVNNAKFAPPYDIPIMKPCYNIPSSLISFSEAVSTKANKREGFVHFYENDEKIERFWNNPNRYLSILGQFEGVISPDYSLYRDFPESMKIWNTYRNFASGCWLQSKGLNVIANVRLSGKQSSKYALSGAPHDSVIAIGAHGNIKNIENQDYFYIDVATIVNELHPRAIIVYGPDSKGIFEYPKALGIPLYFFENTRYLRFSRKAPSDQATK